jgi:hypothetical protein
MPFVKLDCNILNSSLWIDRDAREIFITALLMAVPHSLDEETQEYGIGSNEPTGWMIPPGEYGFVAAASVGICRQACIEVDKGMAALIRLAQPEPDSRTPSFDGRRMVRVDGGFVVLNFRKYRDKDHTAAERQRRYREKKRNAATSRNGVTLRNITQAEAEAEADTDTSPTERVAVPHQKIVDLYHEYCPALPRVKKINSKRQAALRARWKTFSVEVKGKEEFFNDLYTWERYFKFITNNCPFLLGENDRNWVANFDFCIRETAMVGVFENKYVARK